ncbi:hypothetical protein DL95DRAFT_388188 [Leptodontidium sp. 2 PMI_412]|nr:hypothetical protein DL95DRAFT_388188 [Leptodontidium sp. 2 PMI_412]
MFHGRSCGCSFGLFEFPGPDFGGTKSSSEALRDLFNSFFCLLKRRGRVSSRSTARTLLAARLGVYIGLNVLFISSNISF